MRASSYNNDAGYWLKDGEAVSEIQIWEYKWRRIYTLLLNILMPSYGLVLKDFLQCV